MKIEGFYPIHNPEVLRDGNYLELLRSGYRNFLERLWIELHIKYNKRGLLDEDWINAHTDEGRCSHGREAGACGGVGEQEDQ